MSRKQSFIAHIPCTTFPVDEHLRYKGHLSTHLPPDVRLIQGLSFGEGFWEDYEMFHNIGQEMRIGMLLQSVYGVEEMNQMLRARRKALHDDMEEER